MEMNLDDTMDAFEKPSKVKRKFKKCRQAKNGRNVFSHFQNDCPFPLNLDSDSDAGILHKKTINLKKFSPEGSKSVSCGITQTTSNKDGCLALNSECTDNRNLVFSDSGSEETVLDSKSNTACDPVVKYPNFNSGTISETYLGSCYDLTTLENCPVCGKLYEAHQLSEHKHECQEKLRNFSSKSGNKTSKEKSTDIIICEWCNKDISSYDAQKRNSHMNK